VNVTGENVKKGQLIAKVYSPELLTAQNELLQALEMADKYPAMLDAAREKLRLWKLSDQQIADIEKSGKATTVFDVFATTSGIVTNRKVNTGDYVSTGDVLFEMADLSRVWALFDAYETDLSWISLGQNLEFTAQAIPGKTFSGKVTFIDPVVDASTRITKVRVEVPNPGLKFKPEMFVNGIIKSQQTGSGDQLIIPQSAVLWTGTRSVVYVKLPGADHPTFKMREITLGSSMKDTYVVMDGLAEGEEIVTNGTFSIDAAAQLAGKTSMMNPEGGTTSSMPGMIMSGDTKTNDGKNMQAKETSGETKPKQDNSMLGMDMPATPKSKVPNSKAQVVQKAMFGVSGNCEMCKDRIETAASSVKGVSTAVWDVKTKKIDVEYMGPLASIDIIQKAIAKAGHDTGKYKADNKTYQGLPECCLYRK